MDYSDLGYVFIGVSIYVILRLLISFSKNRFSLIDKNQIEFILFVGNLAFISIGFVFTFYSIRVTALNAITPDDLKLFDKWIYEFTNLSWVLSGIGLGAIITVLASLTARKKLTANEIDEIKVMAYEIWEQQGRPEGKDLEIWLEAQGIWAKNKKQRAGKLIKSLNDLGFAIFAAGWPFFIVGLYKLFTTPNIPELNAGLFSIGAGLIYLTMTREIQHLKDHSVDVGLAVFAPSVPLLIIGFSGGDYVSAIVGTCGAVFGFILAWIGERRSKDSGS